MKGCANEKRSRTAVLKSFDAHLTVWRDDGLGLSTTRHILISTTRRRMVRRRRRRRSSSTATTDTAIDKTYTINYYVFYNVRSPGVHRFPLKTTSYRVSTEVLRVCVCVCIYLFFIQKLSTVHNTTSRWKLCDRDLDVSTRDKGVSDDTSSSFRTEPFFRDYRLGGWMSIGSGDYSSGCVELFVLSKG